MLHLFLPAVAVVLMLQSGLVSPTLAQSSVSGRLGGTLDEIEQRFGQPTWTDAGLIGYNEVDINGIPTILVVYYDSSNAVTKISLVYTSQPTELSTPEDVKAAILEVTPIDSNCLSEATTSGFGSEVYACESKSLLPLYSPQYLEQLGVKGTAGSFSYAVDPAADEYYEIVVQLGTDTIVVPPTAVPTQAPTMDMQYPPVADIRELAIGRSYVTGDPLSFSGTVLTIVVAEPGMGFVMGLNDEFMFSTLLQVNVSAPDGSIETIIIGYDGDTTGIFEGTWVTVYGNLRGADCFVNALGGEICQPLIESVEILH